MSTPARQHLGLALVTLLLAAACTGSAPVGATDAPGSAPPPTEPVPTADGTATPAPTPEPVEPTPFPTAVPTATPAPEPTPVPTSAVPGEVAARLAALEAAVLRWEATGGPSYAFTIFRGCNCLPEWTGPFDVVVTDGVAVATREGAPVEPDVLQYVPLTVEELFLVIREHVGDPGFEAVYDAATGVPLRFFADPDLMMADEELALTVTWLGLR